MVIQKTSMDKSGVFKTLEALMAIFITFLFLLVFIPQQREQATRQAPPNALVGLAGNDDFRNCAITRNFTCINQTIDKQLEDKYDFRVNISESQNAILPLLPQKRIYANTLFIAGNMTKATTRIVRLFFWEKS